MLLKKILKKENIVFLTESTKKKALKELIELISDSPAVKDKKKLEKSIFAREKLMSTGIGLGVAIPHVKIDSVSELEIVVGVSHQDIDDYESLDKKPVRLIFLIIAHTNQHANYLSYLAEISKIITDNVRRKKIRSSKKVEQVYEILVS